MSHLKSFSFLSGISCLVSILPDWMCDIVYVQAVVSESSESSELREHLPFLPGNVNIFVFLFDDS